MSVLAIDTAGPVVGAARSDGRIFTKRVVRGADVALSEALAQLLDDSPLELVCVSVGPGGFTSLRVGVAAALGVAIARRVPVLPMSSLAARALLCPEGRTLSLLDGRKSKAYAAVFLDGVLQGEERDLPPSQAVALTAGHPFTAVGEGAVVFSEDILAAGGSILEDPARSPVLQMCAAADRMRDQAISPQALRLRYLREADAKLPSR
ncbi:MAG: tRNA (adenosine(37)-N6)-threonylcarbamoyltransferase complex dimerization subunit type 1 TsaB [Myxococcota bacterium]|nr:tRNA (adenosine(37)-N6)-threonylcarbamoyltransferase complex dimerization subunit type 1 TsaB [Myxococcota bacterium]